jgi:multidrug efflux pump subunit AcrA (membrane-fusion protein)
VSETVSRGREAGHQAELPAAAAARGSRGRGRLVALGILVVVAAGAVSAWRAGVFSPATSSVAGGQGAPASATAAVTRQDIAAVTPMTATLGYADSYLVTGRGGGTLTWLPSAGRVGQVTRSLGGLASGPVLAATSDRHVVTISLSTSQESQMAVGDAVTVTLPDNASAPGTVSSVGTVASGTAGNATIQVTVTLTHPSAAGTLDQAPVTVNITTASVKNALAVPVTALLAQAGGGYDVEVVEPANTRRYVPVTTGVFDDADGLVQVTRALTPGQRVVVPAS